MTAMDEAKLGDEVKVLPAEDAVPLSTLSDDDALYDRHSPAKKALYVLTLAICGVPAPMSSTGSLVAAGNIADTFATSASIVNISNGVYIAMMGISAILWGPLGTLVGRRPVVCTGILLFFLCSVGTALAPNLALFFVMRLLGGAGGTAVLIAGSGCIGDLYKPTERATALGWFVTGTILGPSIGPVIGGVIVTYGTWRHIFWFQCGLSGLGMLLAFTILPETIHRRSWAFLPSKSQKTISLLKGINPCKIPLLFQRMDLFLVSLASASLIFSMYAIITPIPHVLNPRYNLQTPWQAGLFYLAPGAGYFLGTLCGGRWADHVVRRWKAKMGGVRRPEDRLRSGVWFMWLGMTVSVQVYSWCVQTSSGGIPVTVVALFVQGFCQLMVFPCLNTYCLDILPGRSAEVVADNYLVRYLFGALGNVVALPAINAMGVGAFNVIASGFVLTTCAGLFLVIHKKV